MRQCVPQSGSLRGVGVFMLNPMHVHHSFGLALRNQGA